MYFYIYIQHNARLNSQVFSLTLTLLLLVLFGINPLTPFASRS